VLIAFGDVSGKGAAAALYGALLGGLLRIVAPRRRNPAQLLTALNELLLERKVDAQYATLILGQYEPSTRQMLFANAGAEPPLVCRAGDIIKPRVEGVPIGLLEDREYDEVRFQMEPGDIMVFYSDGVEDQVNDVGEDYSRSRLAKLIKKHCDDPPQAIADAVINELDLFRDGTSITDDQTIVVMNILA
jgi:sigma-B regulation protein RsbU (phosphoserine phosphatase)